jgi:hypothetical protein
VDTSRRSIRPLLPPSAVAVATTILDTLDSAQAVTAIDAGRPRKLSPRIASSSGSGAPSASRASRHSPSKAVYKFGLRPRMVSTASASAPQQRKSRSQSPEREPETTSSISKKYRCRCRFRAAADLNSPPPEDIVGGSR